MQFLFLEEWGLLVFLLCGGVCVCVHVHLEYQEREKKRENVLQVFHRFPLF